MQFEKSIKRIDEIISALENSEISLEESIQFYKEGTELIGTCREQLEKAEMLVTVADENSEK